MTYLIKMGAYVKISKGLLILGSYVPISSSVVVKSCLSMSKNPEPRIVVKISIFGISFDMSPINVMWTLNFTYLIEMCVCVRFSKGLSILNHNLEFSDHEIMSFHVHKSLHNRSENRHFLHFCQH